ncbi:FAD/NAD(P)-binding protein [Acetobacteraceae bacterium KSS8]|uniref:FAD/NAD(P)-binding protein n=1 Tax=Endosaccharibacter trunci TaxID=2812733 RepID=A0ABT1W3T6_9PROT|nr:FAD/NAD(P)-binding protein [Acetobacteraceae bacterium KSS8]
MIAAAPCPPIPAPPRSAALILVGAGLSGAAFLAHLLRDHPGLCGRVLVLEPRRRLGAGLAYATCDPAHRVNVSAGRMSLFPDQPSHFADWLSRTGAAGRDREALSADGSLHPRRALFGRYVHETVSAQIAAATLEVVRLRESAISAEPGPEGWSVTLETGDRWRAPLMVLAVGHSAPDLPAPLRSLAADPRLVADPWARDALAGIAPEAAVLVVGTGLTGCDVIASLRARGHRGRVLMVSRRGLLPRPRTPLPVESFGRFDDRPSVTARALLRRVRAAVAAAAALGRPWEDVVAALREQAGPVWGSLPVVEKRRLLRHARPFWDVHRFQCAPQIDRAVADGLASGWLSVRAASLVAAAADTEAIRVRIGPRGGGSEEVSVAAVVNCTGPGHRSVVESHPLLRALAKRGVLRADPCRLGIDVDGTSRVLGHDGVPAPGLFVAGPLARFAHGELMGLPQVALQPRDVAASVAAIWPRDRAERLSRAAAAERSGQ